jgi:hypothetical protein
MWDIDPAILDNEGFSSLPCNGIVGDGCGSGLGCLSPGAASEPTLPLLGYTLLPPSLTPTLWPVYTATPFITADSTGATMSAVALNLRVIGPACHETPVGSLICMGQVRNTLDVPVEQITVEVQLLGRDGNPLMVGEGYVTRWVLPAGAAGPYRVLFEKIPEGYAGAYPSVKSGRVMPSSEQGYADLALRPISGEFVYNQYQVAVSIVNKSDAPVEHLTVTMTLLDRHGNVTGFRQVYLDDDRWLAPGESLALTIKVVPQGPDTVAFDAFAEGLLASK